MYTIGLHAYMSVKYFDIMERLQLTEQEDGRLTLLTVDDDVINIDLGSQTALKLVRARSNNPDSVARSK